MESRNPRRLALTLDTRRREAFILTRYDDRRRQAQQQSQSEESPRVRQMINEHEEINEGGAIQEISGKENNGKSLWFLWLQLPADLQKLIVQHLLPTVYDYMNFRAVCKEWRSLALPFRWKPSYSGIPYKYPWFMFSRGNNGRYKFYDPIANLMPCMSIPELEGCVVHFSKQGWLLVTKTPSSIFFFEPFTRTRIQLPDLVGEIWFHGFCFSDPPTCSNWHIFGIRHLNRHDVQKTEILYLRSGAEFWRSHRISDERLPRCCLVNPYCYGRSCCYLGDDGTLVFIKFKERSSTWSWSVATWSSRSLPVSFRKFLFGFGKELISVCLDEKESRMINVFKCDFGEKKWVQIKSLEEKALYLSQTTSLCVDEIMDRKVKNTIQLPKFSIQDRGGGSNISFSFKNQTFQICKNINTQVYSPYEDLYESMEFPCGFWIQPLVMPQMIDD